MVRKKKLQVISMKDEKETLSLGLKIEMLYCIRRKNNNGDVCAYDADMLVVGESKDEFDSDTTELRSGRNILTDSLSQIVVTDYNNSCLHIIDQNGLFLKCLKCHGLKQTNALESEQ